MRRGAMPAVYRDEPAASSTVDLDVDESLRLTDVRKLARRAVRGVVRAARVEDRASFGKLLREHLGTGTESVDVVEEAWPGYDQVNVQAAMDAWLAAPGREHELVGVLGFRHTEFGLAELLRSRSFADYDEMLSPGNVSRVNLACGPGGEVRACVRCGVYLVRDGARRTAVLLRGPESDMGRSSVSVQVASDDPETARRTATELRALSVEHNVYRGQVVSFGGGMFGEREAALRFHTRPRMSTDDLILPADTLAAIRRQVVGVAEHRERLLTARQHLKRGLLLYGPPGVGKTHTVRYLVSQLTGTTIVQLSGDSLYMIGQACSVARTLQPAMIVVEDVDLIAEDRGDHPGHHPLLFQLLNEMDGLAEDADVVFLLTTNRVDVLEPALAARPGRVDQAVELDLPDVEARRRLFGLYRGDLQVDESRLDAVLERTSGVTASFLKELLRRAAVVAAETGADARGEAGVAARGEAGARTGAATGADGALHVGADQLDAALDELLDTRNAMTRVLLGGGRD